MQLLTVEQVARMLQKSPSSIYQIKDKIGYYKLEGAVRFSVEDVDRYVLSCRVNGEKARKPAPRPRLKHIQV